MPGERGPAQPSKRITIALVNDYELILRGIAEVLRPFHDLLSVVEWDADQNPERRVDVALFDPYARARLGLERVVSLVSDPNVGNVAIYTWAVTAAQRDQALHAGARGIIAKATGPRALADALLEIAAGGTFVSPEFGAGDAPPWPGHEFGLTLRESDVAALLADGLSNKQIADALWISENTVKTHLKAVFQKAHVSSRTQAIARIKGDVEFARRRTA